MELLRAFQMPPAVQAWLEGSVMVADPLESFFAKRETFGIPPEPLLIAALLAGLGEPPCPRSRSFFSSRSRQRC